MAAGWASGRRGRYVQELLPLSLGILGKIMTWPFTPNPDSSQAVTAQGPPDWFVPCTTDTGRNLATLYGSTKNNSSSRFPTKWVPFPFPSFFTFSFGDKFCGTLIYKGSWIHLQHNHFLNGFLFPMVSWWLRILEDLMIGSAHSQSSNITLCSRSPMQLPLTPPTLYGSQGLQWELNPKLLCIAWNETIIVES